MRTVRYLLTFILFLILFSFSTDTVFASNSFNGVVINASHTRLHPPDVSVQCVSNCTNFRWIENNHFDAAFNNKGTVVIRVSNYPSQYVGCSYEILDRGSDVYDNNNTVIKRGVGCEASFNAQYNNDWRYGVTFKLHDCSISTAASCINNGTQVRVSWNNTSHPELNFDRFVVRGADSTKPWPENGVFRDMGAGNKNVNSTVFNIGPNEGEVESGVPFIYDVAVNNGGGPNYLLNEICRSNKITLSCAVPTSTPRPNATNTPVPTNTPIPSCTITNGDANSDGQVNGNDFTTWVRNFDPSYPVQGGSRVGDFNCDNYVNGNDFSRWLANFTP